MLLPIVYNYDVIEKIGDGSFSAVVKAVTKTTPKEIIAIQYIDCTNKSVANRALEEILLLKTVNFEHIVSFIDVKWDKNQIFIISEYCDEGNLSQYIKKKQTLTETQVKTFMQHLVLGLRYLHRKDICHINLEPCNLLLSSRPRLRLKIANFGLSQIIPWDNAKQSKNILYMAPEKLLDEEFDARIDLWSVGIILYECLFGAPPYLNLKTKTIIGLMHQRASIKLPPNKNISSTCQNLLFSLLKHKPNERISFEDFFNHQFIDLIHVPSIENYLAAMKKAKDINEQCYQNVVHDIDASLSVETDLNKRAVLYLNRMQMSNYYDMIANYCLHLQHVNSFKYEILRELPHVSANIDAELDNCVMGILYIAEGKHKFGLAKLSSALTSLILLNIDTPFGLNSMLDCQIKEWQGVIKMVNYMDLYKRRL